MNMRRIKERLEGVTEVLDKIRQLNRDIPIIVEGRNDVFALRKLGFEGDIIKIKRGKSVFHIIEDLSVKHDEIIVLTDWDRTGGRLAHRVKKACKANTIKCHERYRKRIIKYVKKDVKDVEGLPKFISRAKREVERSGFGRGREGGDPC